MPSPLTSVVKKVYAYKVFAMARSFFMEHEAHISEKSDISWGGRIVVALVVVAALIAGGAYLVYGSGLWSP